MSKYCIMRFQKYKLGSVANIERHQYKVIINNVQKVWNKNVQML